MLSVELKQMWAFFKTLISITKEIPAFYSGDLIDLLRRSTRKIEKGIVFKGIFTAILIY